ncbi:RNA polymerase sigma factor [Parabacteroides timonensis]|uniref:RNA polymerase sigma factor n=1 Tax=Parabacteroides timonensis TaxID=1871013 RepID=UPI00094ECD51|nr:RNA polymerase sigma factor [Parabacteroides timonensis]
MDEFNFDDELLAVQDELLRFAYSLTTDWEKAKDLLQDTLLRALSHKEKYSTHSNFKGWLFVIMRNIFINGYWKEVNNSPLYIASDPTYFSQIKDDSHSAKEDIAYDIEIMYDALNDISDIHYRSFEMYLSGFKYREIAEKTGASLGTVKSRIFHCRKKLKAILGKLQNKDREK